MRTNKTLALAIFILLVLPTAVFAADPPLPLAVDGYVFNADGSPAPAGTKVTVVNIGTGMLEETFTGQNFPPLSAYANRYSASLGYQPGAGDSVKILAQSGSWFGEASATASSGRLEMNVMLTQQTPYSQPSLSGTIEKLKEEAAAPTPATNETPSGGGTSATPQKPAWQISLPHIELPSTPAEAASTIAYVSVGLIIIALILLVPFLARNRKPKGDKEKKIRTYGIGLLVTAAGFLLVAALITMSSQPTALATGEEGGGAQVAAPPSPVSVDGYVYNSTYATGSLTGNGTIVNVSVLFPNGTTRNLEQTYTGSGFPPAPQFYPQYAASVTGQLGVDTVNVTATNGTHIGRNSSIAASAVHLNIAITEPLAESAPPKWSGNSSLTPATYSPTFNSQFNVTWTDSSGISNVTFELDISGAPVNYSSTLQNGNAYSFVTVVPAGTFHWKSYATDIFGNQNVTDNYAFTVGQAANPVDLFINNQRNQNVTIAYGTQSNATGTSNVGTVALFRDEATASNPDVTTLAANTAGYAYKVNTTGNANYSANFTGLTFYLVINKASSSITLLLNGTNGDRGYLQNELANFDVTTVPSGLQVSLFSNFSNGVNKLFQSGNSPLANLTTLNTLGVFNFTAVFSGNQNYTAATVTHFATVTAADAVPPRWVNANSSTQTPTAGSSLTLDANWTDNVALDKAVLSTNETGVFTNFTTQYGSPITMSGTSFDSGFSWSTGSFAAGTVIAWRIYANDTSDNQNVTPINTFTIQPAPPAPAPAGGGGGGGGGAAYVPPAKAAYQTAVSPLIERDQPIDLTFNITNPTGSSYDVYAAVSITSGGVETYHSNITITVLSGGITVRTEHVGAHICSSPAPGLYDVNVEWHLSSGDAVVGNNHVRYAVAECTDGEITIATDKSGYSPNDTATISAAIRNIGNVPLHAKLELNMSSAVERVVGDYDVDLLVAQNKTFSTTFDLKELQNGTHMLRAVLFQDKTIYDEKRLSFTVMRGVILVVAPLPIEAILLGLLALLLAYLLTQRKPIRIIKEAELLNGFIKVTVTAINLRPYPFRDVIVEDTMPVKYEPQHIQPKPGRVWLTEGAAKVQWKFDLDATTEEKQGTKSFTYTLRIKDLVKGLPRPHLIFYRWHPDPVKLLKVAEMRKGLVYVTVTAVNKKAFGFKDMIAEDKVPFRYELKSVQPRPYRFRIVEDGRTMRWMFDIDATTYEKQGQTRFTYVMRLKKLVNWLPRPILRKYTREELCG
jgi:hypothetical protein